MFRLGVFLGVLALVGVKSSVDDHNGETDHNWRDRDYIITAECACDFDISFSDNLIVSETAPFYCQMPSSKGSAAEDGSDRYYCMDVEQFEGRKRCDSADIFGNFLCRNAEFCFASGNWDNAKAGAQASMDCGPGWTGMQYRDCGAGGGWGRVNRDGCERDGPVFCGRGSRDDSCECAAPQMRYMAENGEDGESLTSGFKYSGWGEFTSPPSDYAGEGEGMVYYCGAPDRGRKCGADGDYASDCGCPAGEIKVERKSRSDAQQEWWCTAAPNKQCGKYTPMHCSGGYSRRNVGCLAYAGEGWAGNWCGEDKGGDWFYKMSDEAANCSADTQCADECGTPVRRRLAVQPARGWSDLNDYIGRKLLADGENCVATAANFHLRCKDLDGSGNCEAAKQCVSKDSNNADANTSCNRVNNSKCATYTSPRHGDGYCMLSSAHACTWHHTEAEHFREYCRARDHWSRPANPCRNRRSEDGCLNDDDACEWITKDAAIYALNDLDRCSRYDNFENLCDTINSCFFECNDAEDDQGLGIHANRQREGQCEAHIAGRGPHCRGIHNDGDCFDDDACFWNYLGNCRCRTGEGGEPSEESSEEPDPTKGALPSEECVACRADACQFSDEEMYECAGESEQTGACDKMASGMGWQCDGWSDGEETCTFCAGKDNSTSFFNEDLDNTPVGARGYQFCAGGRGVESARCLPTGKFGETSGTCVEVTCQAVYGTNWGRTANGQTVYVDCGGDGEEGYMRRQCDSSGEWGPVDDQCTSTADACGIAKDAFGVWPKTAGGTRAMVGCTTGYHGVRYRDCASGGHWGNIIGECFHECYDILARKNDHAGDLILFKDRPFFEVNRNGNPLKYTCYNPYGRVGTSTYVLSLKNSPQRQAICDDSAEARSNCPEVCNNPKCDNCKDTAGTFNFFWDEKGRDVPLRCSDARQATWSDRGVCGGDDARTTCPLTCNACGGGCKDSQEGFNFRGEEHYCHETHTNDDFCEYDEFRSNCPDLCGEVCVSAEEGGDSGGDCPKSDPDYLFSFYGTIMPFVDANSLSTSCHAIKTGIISLAQGGTPGDPSPAGFERQICSIAKGSDPYYDDKPTPSEACLAECNGWFPDDYPCTVECKAVPNGTWVWVDADGEEVPAKVSGQAEDCKAVVDYYGGGSGEYDNASLTSMVGMCECDNRVGEGELACVEGGWCSRHTDGMCFPGETLCYI